MYIESFIYSEYYFSSYLFPIPPLAHQFLPQLDQVDIKTHNGIRRRERSRRRAPHPHLAQRRNSGGGRDGVENGDFASPNVKSSAAHAPFSLLTLLHYHTHIIAKKEIQNGLSLTYIKKPGEFFGNQRRFLLSLCMNIKQKG